MVIIVTSGMGQITKGLGVINNPLSGGPINVAIKVRLLDSFAWKGMKIKKVQPWLHQVEAYLETQHFELDKEKIHFAQTDATPSSLLDSRQV